MATHAPIKHQRRSAQKDVDRGVATHPDGLATALGRAGAPSDLGAGWLCSAVSAADTKRANAR